MMLLSALLLLSASSISEAKTIPKTIIQTSKDKVIDRLDWIEYQNSLREVNPDFELVHFDDVAAREFISEHYSGTILEHAYDMATPIMRADLFRLAAIYKLGGFYFDMDMLGKTSLNPMVEAIKNGEYQAVFPKEWWTSAEFYHNIFPGREPQDGEDHWQVGQYAFAAVPEHYFIKEALEEAIVRTVNLMTSKGDDVESIRDVDILAATGPYLFTELYHTGRKEGRYTDVFHIQGDSEAPVLEHRHGGPDWHKFGPYCEHMLSHTWVKPERRKLEEYGASATTVTTSVSPGLTWAEYGVSDNWEEYGISDKPVTLPTMCEFCPGGLLVEEDYVLPDGSGTTCGGAMQYAATVDPSNPMCPTVQQAQAICCPSAPVPDVTTTSSTAVPPAVTTTAATTTTTSTTTKVTEEPPSGAKYAGFDYLVAVAVAVVGLFVFV